jgi:hypothetical protein
MAPSIGNITNCGESKTVPMRRMGGGGEEGPVCKASGRGPLLPRGPAIQNWHPQTPVTFTLNRAAIVRMLRGEVRTASQDAERRGENS